MALVAISPNDPLAVRLDELGYTDVGDSFEDMKLRAKDRKFRVPLPLRRRDAEDVAGLRRAGHAAGVSLRSGPQAALRRPDRRLRGEDRRPATTPATPSTRCWPASRCRSRRPACSAARPSGPTSGRTPRSRWRSGTRSRSTLARSTKPAWPSWSRTTPTSCWWSTSGRPGAARAWPSCPSSSTMNRMYRKRNFQLVTISMDEPEQKDAALKVLRENHARGDELHLRRQQQGQARRPARQGVARAGAVHAADRPRRQGDLPQERPASTPLEVRRAIVDFIGRTYASRTSN